MRSRPIDEVYASLAYNGAPLLRVPVCVRRALLVAIIVIEISLQHGV